MATNEPNPAASMMRIGTSGNETSACTRRHKSPETPEISLRRQKCNHKCLKAFRRFAPRIGPNFWSFDSPQSFFQKAPKSPSTTLPSEVRGQMEQEHAEKTEIPPLSPPFKKLDPDRLHSDSVARLGDGQRTTDNEPIQMARARSSPDDEIVNSPAFCSMRYYQPARKQKRGKSPQPMPDAMPKLTKPQCLATIQNVRFPSDYRAKSVIRIIFARCAVIPAPGHQTLRHSLTALHPATGSLLPRPPRRCVWRRRPASPTTAQ
jgi:hypothetical protein